MRLNLFSPLARRIQKLVAVGALAVLTTGCVAFNGSTTTTQFAASGDVGTTLRYAISVCTNGSGFPAATNAGGVCAASTGIGASTGRIAVGVLVPTGSTAPAVVTATLSTPVTVTRAGVPAVRSDVQAFRTMTAAADFNAQTPPPAGSTWIPYITESISVPASTSVTADATIDVALPVDSNGNPPAAASRQVSLADAAAVAGTDPTPGQTDTLTFDCYVDVEPDGTPEAHDCADVADPVASATVTLRRLTLTGESSATVQATGAAVTTDATLRLDGTALPSSTVDITTSYSGTGVTATAADATAVVGSDVDVPVQLTAAAGATSGNLTITATTSNGTGHTAIVPVTVSAAPTPPVVPVTPTPPVVPVVTLPADDGTRPVTTIDVRRSSADALRIVGTASDANRSAGLRSVKVQAFRGVRNGRCLAWNGKKIVNEPCTRSLARWITLPLTIAPATTSLDWATTTPVVTPGLWVVRARAADGDSLVSRVATEKITVPDPTR